MTVEEATPKPTPAFDVWPDNWVAVCVFVSIETQWRVGFGGAYGLDYNVLYHKLDRLKLDSDEYDDIEASVRELESQALIEMREQEKQAAKKKGKK